MLIIVGLIACVLLFNIGLKLARINNSLEMVAEIIDHNDYRENNGTSNI